MNVRTIIVAVLALVFGITAAVSVNRYLAQPQQAGERVVVTKVETTSIVVAAIDVARATTLTPDMLTTKEWPKDLVPPGALTDLNATVDRTLVTSLVRGEPVLEGKVADGRGLEPLITVGMRATTILTPTPAAGVAGFILPGNRVDVLLTVSDSDPSHGGATISTLLQNIEVLAVADLLDAPAENKVQKMSSVTLSCTPENCAKLSLGGTKGTLHLTLRNGKDKAAADTRVIAMNELQFIEEPPQADGPPENAIVTLKPKLPQKIVVPAIQIRTLRARGSGKILIRPAQEVMIPLEDDDADLSTT